MRLCEKGSDGRRRQRDAELKTKKHTMMWGIPGVQIDLNDVDLGCMTVCSVETRVKDLVTSINNMEWGRMTMAEMRVL